MMESAEKEIPAGRIGQPEDIGNAVVFLASDEAAFVNGIELTVERRSDPDPCQQLKAAS